MKDNSVGSLIAELAAIRLGTLAFNLGAIAWIALNVQFGVSGGSFQPGCYVTPNVINLLAGPVLLYSCYLAILAIKRGSLIPAFITLTFVFAMVATLIRQLFYF